MIKYAYNVVLYFNVLTLIMHNAYAVVTTPVVK
jgi:hypothetical protein